MNDMPSQALAQLVETRAPTLAAFRNVYGLRKYSLKMRYGLREYSPKTVANTVLEKPEFKKETLVLPISLLNRSHYCS